MSLKRLYNLNEAGVQQGKAPATQGKKKPKPSPRISGNVKFPLDPEDPFAYPEGEEDSPYPFKQAPIDDNEPIDDEDDGDLGPDMGYDDPVEPESDGEEEAPEPIKKPVSSFASKSAPPSAALRGGKPGLEVKADKETIKALLKALNAVRTRDDDLNSWIDDCIREIERSKDGSVTLPKFESSDFDDEDEE